MNGCDRTGSCVNVPINVMGQNIIHVATGVRPKARRRHIVDDDRNEGWVPVSMKCIYR